MHSYTIAPAIEASYRAQHNPDRPRLACTLYVNAFALCKSSAAV